MIIKGSRYKADVDVKDDVSINVAKPVYFEMKNFIVVTTKEGDSFESLASRYLKNPNLYWKIASCNTYISFPDYIEPGTRLRIPLS